MIKLYPNRAFKALLTLTVASFSVLSLSAQCPTGSVSAVAGTTYTNGQVVCVSGNFTSGTITLNSGSQLVIATGGSFKGNINAASNVQIYVQADATFQPGSVNNFVGKITNYGTTTIKFNLPSGTEVINNKSLEISNGVNLGNVTVTNSSCGYLTIYGGLNLSGNASTFSNNGSVSVVGGGLTLEGGNQLINRGQMYVNGKFILRGKITNDGRLVFSSGNSTIEGSDSLINRNVFVIGGSATVNKAIRNDGLFWIGGAASFQNSYNFNQTNAAAYLRVDGSMTYANVVGGSGVAHIAGSKASQNGGQFLLATTTTVKDTNNYAAVGANAAKPCGSSESQLPLPIILQNFTAKASGSAAQLNWSTVSELNGKAMIVQHSTDGVSFEDIQTVASTTNSSLVQNYSYIDNNVANGVNYYRLKLVSSDAPISYSAVVAVKFNATAEQQAISVFPNPFLDHFTVKFADVKGSNVVAKLYNAQGAAILVQSFNSAASVTINTPATLAKGVYVLEISANGEKYYHRLMKL
ncbi:T9SS type A sorting domain-containing protein [Pinibacter aurantiacus]|uniref:T9SS type A sorting domain-containing protein n=1 Tax=Pinibacter aurantiacus TaxID=2851599 RepID=A0A9E2W6Q1_9BACT|nr:T9SS type A sorting domain-containing protein [Pinibacter aurantiacus]MBV4355531.1 T9SS type A sorting domain-containing protein [Pinibacter aurantiacus]